MRARLPSFSLVLLVAAACGGGDSASGQPDAGNLITCQNDPRVASYAPGLTVTSTSGAKKFVLVEAQPAPPARGTDTWTLRITDGAGTPLVALPVSVLPFMPDHGHGSSVGATVTAHSDGTYTAAPLYFFMPGVWRVTFASPPDQQADVAEFFFCIPG
jgi:YtkA-like